MERPSHWAEGWDARIRTAREAFFRAGALRQPTLPPVQAEVVKSWQRCLGSGLASDGARREQGLEDGQTLKIARDRNGWLLHQSRGVLNHLYEQIRSTDSVIVLSDASGLLLDSLGDLNFIDRASKVALQPGASWSEARRGTNAVGTALMEQAPVEIVGSEHYFDCNSILTCSAAPVFDPCGQLIGVVDISADCRSYQRHTLGLVRMTAQMLERRLFEAKYSRDMLLSFHTDPESVGTLQEGMLALSPEGQVLGANQRALDLLGLKRAALARVEFSMLFETPLGPFIDRAGKDPHGIVAADLKGGVRLYGRVRNLPVQAQSRGAGSQALRTDHARPWLGGVPLATTAAATSSTSARAHEASTLEPTLASLDTGDPRLSTALQRASRILGKDIPLLILGESGVGKERFAQAFHASGPRHTGPFVALNCAAIPESLIESELFGYVGGAFTGARKEGAIGKIQQACGGTLFLDEIGDMPTSLQARLLRVLQERMVTPLGGGKSVPVTISLVCATHCNLAEAVKHNRFRQDLYYRVNGLTVTLPSLRERSDIRRIAQGIVAAEAGLARALGLSEAVLAFLERHDWPGNIRQMQNALRVAVALLDDHEHCIDLVHLPEELLASIDVPPAPTIDVAFGAPGAAHVAHTTPAGESLEAIERRAIDSVLAEMRGNVSAASRRLGISRNTLYRKLGRL